MQNTILLVFSQEDHVTDFKLAFRDLFSLENTFSQLTLVVAQTQFRQILHQEQRQLCVCFCVCVFVFVCVCVRESLCVIRETFPKLPSSTLGMCGVNLFSCRALQGK